MKRTIYKIDETIIPNRVIYEKKLFRLSRLDDDCIIKRYFVYTINDKIEKVLLESDHPNCDPTSHMFCIPERLYNKDINSKCLDLIENIFKTFNLDNCYETLWSKFTFI